MAGVERVLHVDLEAQIKERNEYNYDSQKD